ncbi:hypothetical protein ACFQV2_39980 [Actinokineospora soli]|uniref:Uncharacterized protein n=1 Tax=Actinokineospora soli TaxID=1048753 RepID=A0ABW2TXG0_9PSEU
MTNPGDSAATLADELTTLMFDAAPVFATLLGVPGFDERLGDPRPRARPGCARRPWTSPSGPPR